MKQTGKSTIIPQESGIENRREVEMRKEEEIKDKIRIKMKTNHRMSHYKLKNRSRMNHMTRTCFVRRIRAKID